MLDTTCILCHRSPRTYLVGAQVSIWTGGRHKLYSIHSPLALAKVAAHALHIPINSIRFTSHSIRIQSSQAPSLESYTHLHCMCHTFFVRILLHHCDWQSVFEWRCAQKRMCACNLRLSDHFEMNWTNSIHSRVFIGIYGAPPWSALLGPYSNSVRWGRNE